MHPALIIIALSIMHYPSSNELPTDTFQRTAYKAVVLREFGKLPPRIEVLYRRGLEQNVKSDYPIWLTCFYGDEPSGVVDRYGNHCTMRTAASNVIPQKAWIWSPETGFRQVLDVGASSNDRLARKPLVNKYGRPKWKPAKCWADIWFPDYSTPKRWQGSQTYHFAVILPPKAKKH